MRPSTLPAYKECGRFKPGKAQDFTFDGTLRHEALESKLRSFTDQIDARFLSLLDDQSVAGIEWAAEFIRLTAPLLHFPLEIEDELPIRHEETGAELMTGHLDYRCGAVFFDAKWRRRNYREQMAAYALALCQCCNLGSATGHLLFMESQTVETVTFTRAEAWGIVSELIDKMANRPEPVPCDYCSWCARVTTCPPYVDAVEAIRKEACPDVGIFDPAVLWDDPESVGIALQLWHRIKTWGTALEKEATAEARAGYEIPGHELVEKQGRRYVPDVGQAFEQLGLEPAAFLSACNVSIPKLTEARRALDGSPLKEARRDVLSRLGDNLKQGDTTYHLEPLEK